MAEGNRLANESSPYLRQHAANPVDWYAWGSDAFEAAAERDVPILLSVGYSSCHWCHVMAHESFEDDKTASLMNRFFVNVKVDREERPDVDAIYMDATQAMTGRGGWPMTVFLMPDGRPFFAGTYFPNTPRQGMPSFTQILESVHDVWSSRRGDIDKQADQLTAAISGKAMVPLDAALPGKDALPSAGAALRAQYDAAWGGFGGAPKFPQTMAHEALLRLFLHDHDDDVLHVVVNSLDAMASGGIYDHLGGGFSRYSVDAQWIVPHFEKMLYDNALLARLYLHAWQLTGKARFRQVLDETIAYVLRDLHHPDGGFFSAEDADSEGEEGKFYVFSLDEVRSVLRDAGFGDDDIAQAVTWYGVSEAGNFDGHNILFRPRRGDLLRPPVIEHARAALLSYRNRRVRPGLDDKVLTEWNALMLSTLAEAAAATRDDEWLAEAVRTGEFLCAHLRQGDRWLRSWQPDAGARHLAYAADYAALVDAFTRLAEATGQRRWIDEARRTADGLLDRFWDADSGGVFTTGDDAEALVTRPKDLVDNATPSANSVAAVALQRLAALTGVERYRERAEAILRLVGHAAIDHPTAFGHVLAAVDLHASGVTEIVVAGDRPDLVAEVQRRYLPNAVLAWGEPYDSPLWQGRDTPAAYVCRDYVCELPVTDASSLRSVL